MKNIYELSNQEKEKYKKEFNKLNFTKDINIIRIVSIVGLIIVGLMSGITTLIINENTINLTNLMDHTNFILVLSIAIIIYLIVEIYINVAFTRWLKLKHNIEY